MTMMNRRRRPNLTSRQIVVWFNDAIQANKPVSILQMYDSALKVALRQEKDPGVDWSLYPAVRSYFTQQHTSVTV